MIVSFIYASSKNGVIGKDNKLPWGRIKEDMKHFHDLTMGHHVLEGRKTKDSIGKPLPGRTEIVATRNPDYRAEGAIIVTSPEKGVTLAKEARETELFVIGGKEIFDKLLPFADRIYKTEIQIEVDGDVYEPKINEAEWKETAREERLDLNPPLINRTLERKG